MPVTPQLEEGRLSPGWQRMPRNLAGWAMARVKLTAAWIKASDDFEGLFASEAMRRFGHLF